MAYLCLANDVYLLGELLEHDGLGVVAVEVRQVHQRLPHRLVLRNDLQHTTQNKMVNILYKSRWVISEVVAWSRSHLGVSCLLAHHVAVLVLHHQHLHDSQLSLSLTHSLNVCVPGTPWTFEPNTKSIDRPIMTSR